MSAELGEDPSSIRSRLVEPLLSPQLQQERHGVVFNVGQAVWQLVTCTPLDQRFLPT